MPNWSISSADAQPSPAVEFLRINSFSSSRFLAESFLESLRSLNQGCLFLGNITAPITSGPARGPRPTSSIPRIAT